MSVDINHRLVTCTGKAKITGAKHVAIAVTGIAPIKIGMSAKLDPDNLTQDLPAGFPVNSPELESGRTYSYTLNATGSEALVYVVGGSYDVIP